MSIWSNIEKQEDVEFDGLSETVDVLIGSDSAGNNYISIPVDFIITVLKDNGYEIK
jgi:hypothetical protein